MAKAMFSTLWRGTTKYAIEYRSIFIISLPTNQYECLSSVEN